MSVIWYPYIFGGLFLIFFLVTHLTVKDKAKNRNIMFGGFAIAFFSWGAFMHDMAYRQIMAKQAGGTTEAFSEWMEFTRQDHYVFGVILFLFVTFLHKNWKEQQKVSETSEISESKMAK